MIFATACIPNQQNYNDFLGDLDRIYAPNENKIEQNFYFFYNKKNLII